MGSSYNPKIVTDGLVLCLDAANPKSYPGSGTTWFDLSGNKFTGIKSGSQSPTYPQYNINYNGYFTFIGGIAANNYSRFYISNIPAFSSLSAFAWYRTTNSSSDYKTILRMDNSDFELSISNPTTTFVSAGTNWNDIYISSTESNCSDGNWHQIGLTFTGQVLNYFFDSLAKGTLDRGTPTSTSSGILKIGTRNDEYSQHFIGDISQISIYNKALSSTEIQQNFNATRGRYGI